MQPKSIFRYEWDAIAGIAAALVAIVMRLLGVLPENLLPSITLALIAMLFIRHLRIEDVAARIKQSVDKAELDMAILRENLRTDTKLIGPHKLREESENFARRSHGEMIWFNVCLSMFRPQSLFDKLLKPAIENADVTSIHFTLDESQKSLWATDVVPKIEVCSGRQKVREPRWTRISENSISFVLSGDASEGAECLLSFWGEPFMASTIGTGVPRYMFYVYKHSELIPRLQELERAHRIGSKE
jgi:hypothetical protein